MPKRDPDTPPANGKEIRRLRKLLGLSQEELAHEAHMSRKTIISLERNGPASSATIGPLADFFRRHFEKVSRRSLIAGNEPLTPPPDDNRRSFVAFLHITDAFEDYNATHLEGELKAFLKDRGISHQLFVTEIKDGNSTLVIIQVTPEALDILIHEFALGYLQRLHVKQIDIPESVIQPLESCTLHRIATELRAPLEDIYPTEGVLRHVYGQMLRFRQLSPNLLGITRRRTRKRAHALVT